MTDQFLFGEQGLARSRINITKSMDDQYRSYNDQ